MQSFDSSQKLDEFFSELVNLWRKGEDVVKGFEFLRFMVFADLFFLAEIESFLEKDTILSDAVCAEC